MKLSKRQLQRIIREEKSKLIKEARMGGWDGSYGGSVREGMDAVSYTHLTLPTKALV